MGRVPDVEVDFLFLLILIVVYGKESEVLSRDVEVQVGIPA